MNPDLGFGIRIVTVMGVLDKFVKPTHLDSIDCNLKMY